jgi:hypothetical protein
LERGASNPAYQLGYSSSRLVARARIPVLKLVLEHHLELDVSVNGDGGPRAAAFVREWVSAKAGQGRGGEEAHLLAGKATCHVARRLKQKGRKVGFPVHNECNSYYQMM